MWFCCLQFMILLGRFYGEGPVWVLMKDPGPRKEARERARKRAAEREHNEPLVARRGWMVSIVLMLSGVACVLMKELVDVGSDVVGGCLV